MKVLDEGPVDRHVWLVHSIVLDETWRTALDILMFMAAVGL